MRYKALILFVLFAVPFLSSPAFAGDAEVDRRIYDAFIRHLDRIPESEHVKECEKFLEWYPDNVHAPKVQKRLFKLLGKSDEQNDSVDLKSFGEPPPSAIQEPSQEEEVLVVSSEEEAFAEAAEAVDGVVEEEAANALEASENVETQEAPETPAIQDQNTAEQSLRYGKRFGIGSDFSVGALIGLPSFTLDYVVGPHWTLGGSVRFPLVNMFEISFEPRFFFSPNSPYSAYAGMSIGSLSGNIDAMINLLQPGAPPSNAVGATKIGFLGGVQKLTPRGHAFYLEGMYQSVGFAGGSNRRGSAQFPSLSVGYRFFFR